jgi:cytochrome c oxidase subunit IV
MERFFAAHAQEFTNSTASDEEVNKYLNYWAFVYDLSSAIDEIAYYTDSDNQYRFTINALYPRSKIKRIIESLLKINWERQGDVRLC